MQKKEDNDGTKEDILLFIIYFCYANFVVIYNFWNVQETI